MSSHQAATPSRRTPPDPRRPRAPRPAYLGLYALPQPIERDAVVERSPFDHKTLGQLHDPGVAVLIWLPVVGDPAPIPDHDHGVVVGPDPADRDRPERLVHREPGPERRQDLIDELLLAAILLRRRRVSLYPPDHVGGEHIRDVAGSLLPGIEGLADDLPVGLRSRGRSARHLIPLDLSVCLKNQSAARLPVGRCPVLPRCPPDPLPEHPVHVALVREPAAARNLQQRSV